MPRTFASVVFAITIGLAAPAVAADGQVVITQTKALQGGITPSDTAGFPVTLSRAGSYVLGSNLDPPQNAFGIEVTADAVSVDLNGFRIDGATKAKRGIVATGNQANVTIRNGTVSRFRLDGISGAGKSWAVEDMRVVSNGYRGVYLSGSYARVLSSNVSQNGLYGIQCGGTCTVDSSTVAGNGKFGIWLASGIVLGSVIVNNADEGVFSSGTTGFGNNEVSFNNGNSNQISSGIYSLQPNHCSPVAC